MCTGESFVFLWAVGGCFCVCRPFPMFPFSHLHFPLPRSMITDSFLQKADLEHWLMPHVSPSDYSELMDQIWKPLLEKELR